MTPTDQFLLAMVIGLFVCILGLCWSLQQAHYRLDALEIEVWDGGECDEPNCPCRVKTQTEAEQP